MSQPALPTYQPFPGTQPSAPPPASPVSAYPPVSTGSPYSANAPQPGAASWQPTHAPVPTYQGPASPYSAPLAPYQPTPGPTLFQGAAYQPAPTAYPMMAPAPQPAQQVTPIIINNTASAVVGVGYRRKTSHLFHLVMTILTVGLWAPVWIIMAVRNSRP